VWKDGVKGRRRSKEGFIEVLSGIFAASKIFEKRTLERSVGGCTGSKNRPKNPPKGARPIPIV